MTDYEQEADSVNRDGSSAERAVVVGSVREEREWVSRTCAGFRVVAQCLVDIGGRPFDVLTLASETGAQREVYFDISAFFGKGKQPGPPCPYCDAPLRTAAAKQCRKCGTDWHDPSNVIRRSGSSSA